nr:GntR family transcriptional regulator [Gracilibacillus halophilus]
MENASVLDVVHEIRDLIKRGFYQEREKLPTLYELATRFGVTRGIVRDAIEILEEENVLVDRPGVGTFVNKQPILSSGIEELGSVTEMIEKSGKLPGVQYISAEIVEPTEEDMNRFDPLSIRHLAQLERLRTADGEPVVYAIDKVDHHLLPLELIHSQESIFNALKRYAKIEIDYAVAYIEPIGYHERISPMLNCQPDQAILLLKQIHYTKDHTPVLYSANYFRADVFSFYVLRKRMS